jgi:hypothetical protein
MSVFPPLNLDAGGAQGYQDVVDTLFVNDSEALWRNPKFHIALFALDPDPLHVEVGQKSATRLVIRMRHVISGHRSFSGDLADAGHGGPQLNQLVMTAGSGASRVLYQSQPP